MEGSEALPIEEQREQVWPLDPAYPGHIWPYDFLYDRTEKSAQLKAMPMVDEFTRQCYTLDVTRSIKATDVIAQIEQLFEHHGRPDNIRSNNGHENASQAVKAYLTEEKVEIRYVEPGAPWKKRYVDATGST